MSSFSDRLMVIKRSRRSHIYGSLKTIGGGRGRLSHITRGTTEAYYNYDGSGERVRKVVEKSGVVETRLYLGGFEIYRKKNNTGLVLERETLHVMDDYGLSPSANTNIQGNDTNDENDTPQKSVERRCIAIIETKSWEDGSAIANPESLLRYKLSNNVESATLELDDNASIINYEEYYPYGDTSYNAGTSCSEVSPKRYRYTGKERDDESSLYYYGARYYACWLGRWMVADPVGMLDGVNLYGYCRGNPVKLFDPSGKQGIEAPMTHCPIINLDCDRKQSLNDNTEQLYYWSFSMYNQNDAGSDVIRSAYSTAVTDQLGSSLISRNTWGSRDLNNKWERDVKKSSIVIHHTANNKTVQRIDKSHDRVGRRLDGIGYHFLIDPMGNVYEGRPLDMKGSHVGGDNTGRIGISLVGNFEPGLFRNNVPTEDQLTSMYNLIGILQNVYSISNTYIFGHRDLAPRNECPGQNLYDIIKERYGRVTDD